MFYFANVLQNVPQEQTRREGGLGGKLPRAPRRLGPCRLSEI